MVRLRVIALFLSLVMAIQMVPATQIGDALSSNQWTEELPHNTTEDPAKADNTMNKFLPAFTHHFVSDVFFSAASIYIHTSEQIPSNHSNDVVSPPPDAA